jgi:transcriptional regulator with GAF, ATPase, and Fis domain
MPHLIAYAGPLQGRTFSLPEGQWTIGRSPANHLWLDDLEVSRNHCVVVTADGASEIRDLGSRNGTLVNGGAIASQLLQPDDEIIIGASVFSFAATEAATDSGSIAELRPGDSHYTAACSDLPVSPRAQRDLRTLLRLSNLLHSLRNVARVGMGSSSEAMRGRLEGFLLDLISAERAQVISSDAENEIVRDVYRRRVATITRDPANSDRMVLAAPIIARNDVPAVIYLEGRSGERRFDEGHLQFVTAVAEIAAVAWENAELLSWLEEENQRLRQAPGSDFGMIGDSARLSELRRQIARVAPSPASVLITGETGTGKELVAHALHANSSRAHAPFVAINCAAFPVALMESELFGYERGAFTGAVARKRGRLELANGGTVFFDEVGELALNLQAKLLRVLDQRRLERLGGVDTIQLDIRVVAATNTNLEEAVRKGNFREDLYFRLKVVTLKTPALRERPSDIHPLAEHFARMLALESRRKLIGIAPEARACLEAYSWPGNVRELRHAIESAIVLGADEYLLAEDLPEQIQAARPAAAGDGSYAEALDRAKRETILRAFEQAGNDHDAAARLLGLHPNYLRKLLRTLNIKGQIQAR